MPVLLPGLCTQTSEAMQNPKGYCPVQTSMTLIDSFKYEILLQQYGDVIWSSNISRLLTFMIEVWANSA